MDFRIIPAEEVKPYYEFKQKVENLLGMYEKGMITKLELIFRLWELAKS